ncbi:unnamed protein product [Menidia menidia]|uniref:(Atlantic silverside) hypothetical protein n=1 Tax=Menidia menidia TaxID=238744 RepID=A0A8S4B6R1_9TELE|nr:unnamed protein product [Menidia menidia]
MGGHDAGSQHQFTGIAKYFNSYTITGRRNCVLATLPSQKSSNVSLCPPGAGGVWTRCVKM